MLSTKMKIYKFNMLYFGVLLCLWCTIVAEESNQQSADRTPIIDNGGLNPNLKAIDPDDPTESDLLPNSALDKKVPENTPHDTNIQTTLQSGPEIVNEVKGSALDKQVPDNTPLAVDAKYQTALQTGQHIVSEVPVKDSALDKEVSEDTQHAVASNFQTALLPGPQIVDEVKVSGLDKNLPENTPLAVDLNSQTALQPGPEIVNEAKDSSLNEEVPVDTQLAVTSKFQAALIPGPQIVNEVEDSAPQQVSDDTQLAQSINDNVADNLKETKVAEAEQSKETLEPVDTLEENTVVLTDQKEEANEVKSGNETEEIKKVPNELNSEGDNGHVDLEEKGNGMMTGNEDWSKVGEEESVNGNEENVVDDGHVDLNDEENSMETGNEAWFKEGGSDEEDDEFDGTPTTPSNWTDGENDWEAGTELDNDNENSDIENYYDNGNDYNYENKDDDTNIWADSKDDYKGQLQESNDDDEYNYDEDKDNDQDIYDDDYEEDDDEDVNYEDDDYDEDDDEDVDYKDDDIDEDDNEEYEDENEENDDYNEDGYDDEYDYDDDDSSYEKGEQVPEGKDGLWEALDNDPWWKGSGDDTDVSLTSTTESWETTTDYDDEDYSYDWGKESVKDVNAGRNMMESPHHFDNNAGVFAGAKVAGDNSPLDGADRSLYRWTLLLSLCIVVAIFFIFWNRHKVERYIVSLRRPTINGHSHLRRGDEEKNLLEHQYA